MRALLLILLVLLQSSCLMRRRAASFAVVPHAPEYLLWSPDDVAVDASDPKALRLPLLPGDRINWQ